MNIQEQKRLRELADGVMRASTFGMDAAVERAILAAIEPYRAALASSRNLLVKAPTRDGFLNWRTARAENVVAIDALLGEP